MGRKEKKRKRKKSKVQVLEMGSNAKYEDQYNMELGVGTFDEIQVLASNC